MKTVVQQEAQDPSGNPADVAAKGGVRPDKQYSIRIDKQQYEVDADHMTGREILALAGKKT